MSCIATWSFGLEAVRVAGQLIDKGTNCIEAVERAINSKSQVEYTTYTDYIGVAYLCKLSLTTIS